ERLHSSLQFVPLLLANLTVIVFLRLKYKTLTSKAFRHRSTGRYGEIFSNWGLFWALFSAFLYAVSFPSFLNLQGFSYLAWVALVPLFLVIRYSSFRAAVLYGITFGVVQAMLTNYWLGTFQLLSLQVVSVFFILYYLLFMSPVVWLYQKLEFSALRFLVFPSAWVLFDFLRSSGFLGYPWGMLGVTQYKFLPLIQLSSITGVWGITFIVILADSVFSEITAMFLSGRNMNRKLIFPAVITLISVFTLNLAGGYAFLLITSKRDSSEKKETARVALIQQNSDPRKNYYEDTFKRLVRITDESMKYHPDLVAWSETAFVPNIRRWSKYDPSKYPLAKLVKEFLSFQKGLHEWLITGNDDYTLIEKTDKLGNTKTERLDFNASVLFSPSGKRVQTYHKIRLVPFTESFPYKKQLPFIYNLLVNFDVYLWEPGKTRVVFNFPKFKFSTPICFEDAFPQDVRKFVLAGADVILNLSNDYWSLTKVEAKQHFINSIFRTVENRRPLLRSTASGVTAYVDITGRVVRKAPYYVETYLIVDVPVKNKLSTVYTKYGDWFPFFLGGLLIFLFILSLKKKTEKY
ncbi:MAG: apolipoprotein N-acyltransferase, partial [Spirochaetes bacterium]